MHFKELKIDTKSNRKNNCLKIWLYQTHNIFLYFKFISVYTSHFDIQQDLSKITDEQRAANAFLWIKKLRSTQTKKQAEYLGSAKTGLSVLGFGCHLLDIPYFPDVVTSKELMHKTGMVTEKGGFNKALLYNGKHYMCLHELGKNLSFGKVGTFMKRVRTIRAIFKPEVAELVILKIYPNRSNKMSK